MIIKGTDINTFGTIGLAPQKKGGVFSAAENSFARRFDALELSENFKNPHDGGKASDIRKMLSEAENKESAKLIADGSVGFAYLDITLARETLLASRNVVMYSCYAEEKSYYQGLLDGKTDTVAKYDYKYICPENGEFDREQVIQALADVQSRIDALINAEYESKTDFKTYNKCASAFAKAFGIDSSALVLDEDSYDKLFGKIEADEETYLRKWTERAASLRDHHHALSKLRDKAIEKMKPQYAEAVRKATAASYGNSFNDILSFIAKLDLTETESEELLESFQK